MGRVRHSPGWGETLISFGIIAVLVVVAAAVYRKQSRYDPATVIFQPEVPVPVQPVDEKTALFASLPPLVSKNLEPAGAVEIFSSENLADKIDGKAELYLSAGFNSLSAQRFQLIEDPQSWMEVYIYDMGNHQQAFSVYSMQQRQEAEPLALTPFSYRSGNALFFVHGIYYVEAVASVASEPMILAMTAFAQDLVANVSAGDTGMEEIALFPREGLVEGSVSLIVSDAFGFEGLDHVFIALYRVDGLEVTAFVSKRKDTEEAGAILDAYRGFLITFGATEVPEKTAVPDAVALRILGNLELAFAKGRYVAGVRETDHWDAAAGLLQKMWRQLDDIAGQ